MKKKGKAVKWIRKSRSSLLILMLFTMGILVAYTTITNAQQPTQVAAKTAALSPLLDPADTVILLLDHQSGLFQTVKDISVAELRTNTAILAKVAKLAKVPVITTASEPNGPNGPLMPEIHQYAPHAVFIPRKGEISAWDNKDFVDAVRKTGRKTLIMAGVWTSVCVAFPAIQAKAEGYNVYAVIDASGDPSEMTSRTTLARLTQAGIIPVSTNAVFCELQRTWNRPDAAEFGALYAALRTIKPRWRATREHRTPSSGKRGKGSFSDQRGLIADCTQPSVA